MFSSIKKGKIMKRSFSQNVLAVIFCISLSSFVQGNATKIDDISFCIADIKFDGENIKILEFGDGAESMFAGHDALYGSGSIWKKFWHDLAQYKMPIWFVGNHGRSLGVDVLEKLGGQCIQSVPRLVPKINQDMQAQNIRYASGYQGIVFVKRAFQERAVAGLRKKYLNLTFVNQIAHQHVVNKHRTNLLFQEDKALRSFRPACKSCSKKYSSRLAQSIIESFNRDIYVIKPTDSSRGRGVIFTTKDELDTTLRILLQDQWALNRVGKEYPYSYGFWQVDKARNFMIEEYVPSKPITVDGKNYDATMRLVFTAHCVDKKIAVHILGAYWKLPSKALSENGSLTEKHRSNIHNTSHAGSAKVSGHDLKIVSELFCPMMEKVYQKMLDYAAKA